MNQSSSSSKTKSSPAWPKSKNLMKKHKCSSSRSPFQDLNNGFLSSIEAPKGCLRFFFSHSSSSSSTKTNNHAPIRPNLVSTPKSAPNMRPAKENLPKRSIFYKQKLEKVKKNPPKSSWKNVSSCKISSALNSNGITENKLKSSGFDESDLTPLSKVVSGSGLNLGVNSKVMKDDDEKLKTNSITKSYSTSSNSKTPPVQASVSPEIQCGSSMVTTAAKTITPVCYAAGFVMSGVTDKRKCRPRGILTVGEAKPLDCFNTDDETEQENDLEFINNSGISMLPLPVEASMHWLLSPCNEEDEGQKQNSQNKFSGFSTMEESRASPSPETGVLSPNLCDSSSRKKGLCSDLAEENSRFSRDSLGSGNVIQTPQSESTSERKGGISDRKTYNFDFELNSIAEHIQMASLSPKSHVSIWDAAGSSFQFDCLTTPSNSVDLAHFQKVLDERASWLSNSTMENVPQSQKRISWREGLVSRIFEMDEFDSCICLSDAEDDANVSNFNCLKSDSSPEFNLNAVNEPTSTNGSGSTIHVKSEYGSDTEVKEEIPLQVPCSCAESISTDGCGLVRSEDSDWSLCYKNHLFH